MFENRKKKKERIAHLEEQIARIEKQRAETDPADPKYRVLTENLDQLYDEREKHLTPWIKKPEAKGILLGGAVTGLTALALANTEQLHPITSKLFPHAARDVFSNKRRG